MKKIVKDNPDELLHQLRQTSNREITNCLEILRSKYPIVDADEIKTIVVDLPSDSGSSDPSKHSLILLRGVA